MTVGEHGLRGTALVFFVLAATSAGAQEPALGVVLDRLDRLERDFSSIQRSMAREGVPQAAVEPAAPSGTATAARQEIRIGELEEQLRLLTGQLEKAQYELRRLADRVDSSISATEDRLAAIELDRSAPRVGTGAVQPDMTAATNPVRDIDPAEAAVIRRDPNAQHYDTMGVLGTVRAPAPGEAEVEDLPVLAGTEEPGAAAEVTTAAVPAAPSPESQYDHAYLLLMQADYGAAELALQDFIHGNSEHPLVSNAYYWLGETYYVRDDFRNAAVAFARGYKMFPEGNKAAANLLKLGMSFAAMDETRKACATFDKLDRDHADAPVLVRQRLAREREHVGCG